MLLWFVGGSVALVWVVFRDPALDHRLLVAGALLPDVVDAPWGGARVGHTLLAAVVALAAVMAATVGRRAVRRRWLALPIGMFLHLVLDGVWGLTRVFWWPLAGTGFDGARWPTLERGGWSLVLEAVGALLVWYSWHRFGLADPARRRDLWGQGRLEPVAGVS